jgi:transcriptional regulator with PAS, ATPase and Fis domain
MCRDGTLSEEHFDFLWAKVKKQPSDAEPLATAPRSIAGPKTSLKERIHNAEKQAILDALEKAGGNKTRAASLLNIDRTRLYGKLRKHKLL